MECTHLINNVKLPSDSLVEHLTTTKNFTCSECSVKEQTWMCLHCGIVNCGRYVNGHAQYHSEATDHQICISCDVFSVYCYQCDDYVSNDLENGTIDIIRKELMKFTNSQVEQDDKIDPTESENSMHESYPDEDCAKNNGTSILTIESKASMDEPIDKALTENTDNSEPKPLKQMKIEESVRSLRPRSRKRSHSEDNSTDSSIQPFRNNKDKKSSPCNGKSQKEKKIVGLKNLGNTCFMNAVLQSLNNIQEFSCYFSQLPSLEVKTNGRKVYHSRSYTRQDMTEVVMAEELRKVLINLKSGGCGSKGAISPECLFLVIWKVVPRFRGYQQQDAHEFLRYMLDRLHTELLQLMPPERTVDSSLIPKGTSASIVTAVFGGTLQSEVRCLACGTQSNKVDPFLDLSLELPERAQPAAQPALHDCLASFVQVEELADTERYYCSSCKCKQKSTKQFWIRRLPNVLCLHLKRFRWHNYFRTKVDTAVRFPLQSLDMSKFVGAPESSPESTPAPAPAADNQLYDLAAVIVHHGSGAGSGHYTAFAINDDQWFHFNDQTVRATDAAAVASCKPYILFYIRREFS